MAAKLVTDRIILPSGSVILLNQKSTIVLPKQVEKVKSKAVIKSVQNVDLHETIAPTVKLVAKYLAESIHPASIGKFTQSVQSDHPASFSPKKVPSPKRSPLKSKDTFWVALAEHFDSDSKEIKQHFIDNLFMVETDSANQQDIYKKYKKNPIPKELVGKIKIKSFFFQMEEYVKWIMANVGITKYYESIIEADDLDPLYYLPAAYIFRVDINIFDQQGQPIQALESDSENKISMIRENNGQYHL